MLTDRPYVSLRIEMVDCRYDVQLNGVSLATDPKGRAVTMELPVAQWLVAGENEVRIEIYPWPQTGKWPGPDAARASAQLLVRRAGEPDAPQQAILRLVYQGMHAVGGGSGVETSTGASAYDSSQGFAESDAGDTRVAEARVDPMDGVPRGLSVSQKVSIPIALPRWAFLDSAEIPLTEEMTDAQFDMTTRELLAELQKVWDGLNRGDVETVAPLFEERSRELDAAFFKAPGTTQSELTAALRQAVTQGDRTLSPLSFDHSQLVVHPNQRLAKLVGTSSGEGVLAFTYDDGSATERYDVIFRKSGSGWVITR